MLLFAWSIFLIRFLNKTFPSIKVSTSLLKVRRASSLFKFNSTSLRARGFWSLLGNRSCNFNNLFCSFKNWSRNFCCSALIEKISSWDSWRPVNRYRIKPIYGKIDRIKSQAQVEAISRWLRKTVQIAKPTLINQSISIMRLMISQVKIIKIPPNCIDN